MNTLFWPLSCHPKIVSCTSVRAGLQRRGRQEDGRRARRTRYFGDAGMPSMPRMNQGHAVWQCVTGAGFIGLIQERDTRRVKHQMRRKPGKQMRRRPLKQLLLMALPRRRRRKLPLPRGLVVELWRLTLQPRGARCSIRKISMAANTLIPISGSTVYTPICTLIRIIVPSMVRSWCPRHVLTAGFCIVRPRRRSSRSRLAIGRRSSRSRPAIGLGWMGLGGGWLKRAVAWDLFCVGIWGLIIGLICFEICFPIDAIVRA